MTLSNLIIKTPIKKYEEKVQEFTEIFESCQKKLADIMEESNEIQKQISEIQQKEEQTARELAEQAYQKHMNAKTKEFIKKLKTLKGKYETQQETLYKASQEKYDAEIILNYLKETDVK